MIVAIAGVGAYKLSPWSRHSSAGVVSSESTTKEPQKLQVPAITIDETQLANGINGLIAANPELDISVSYRDLSTGTTEHYGITDPFVAASISKLMTASLYLKDIDSGARNLDDPVGTGTGGEQLKLLIEQSDNTAWANFDKLLGSTRFAQFAADIGMKDYDHVKNVTSSEDVALLLQKLYKGELLSKSSTDLLLSHMKAANYTQYIVAALPRTAVVYHKTGYLKDRVHDAAIVDNGQHPYVLVIFTKARDSSYDFVNGPTLIHSIVVAVNKPYLNDQ